MSDQQESTAKLILCPYCGHAQFGGEKCEDCGGLFEPLSRRATQLAMGPWQVRDKHNPFRPGCCYDVIKKMASAGKIKPTTVMRGPTTRQFWSIARNVPGVAHLIGYCHACGEHVKPSDPSCAACGAKFAEHRERNELGLLFKTDTEAQRGQQALDAEIRGETPPALRNVPGPTKRPAHRPSGSDLLANVLDLSGDLSASPALAQASSASPRPGQAPPASTTVAKAIDFSTQPESIVPQAASANTFDVAPTQELPEGGGISGKFWILLSANIIAIATIIILFLFRN